MEDADGAHSRAVPHMGVTVFFNPHWVAEIKIGARTLGIIRHGTLRQCRQRVVIVNTIYRSYHIPMRWWVERCNPLLRSIAFSNFIGWRHDGEQGEHIFWCKKQPRFLKEITFGDYGIKRERSIAFIYLDIERIEDGVGVVLWQKKR